MPGTDELMARLQQLEDGYYGDKEAARQKNFFDTYGGRFSNNRGLGLAILNELDARGVDTSAADEAVTQIIDQLRTECNEIIESLKEVQQDAIENAQKVEEMGNVIDEAVARNADASVDTELSVDEGMPAEGMPAEGMPAEGMPDEGMPAEGMPAEGMPAEGMPAEEEVPPEAVVSDARLKQLKGAYRNARRQRLSGGGFKPSANIISAARGGF